MDSWRVLLATAIIPAIVLLFLVFMCPESPRFLIQRNRYADAYKSLLELRGTPIQAARDLYYIHAQLQTEAITIWNPHAEKSWWSDREKIYAYQSWINRGSFFRRMMCLATNPRTRRACTVALIVMVSQQLCGVSFATYTSWAFFWITANPSNKTNRSMFWPSIHLNFCTPTRVTRANRVMPCLLLSQSSSGTISVCDYGKNILTREGFN